MSGSNQFLPVPINADGDIWPFPRYHFTPQINEKSSAEKVDESHFGSDEGNRSACRGERSPQSDELHDDGGGGRGRSAGGDSPLLRNTGKRRRLRPSSSPAVLGESRSQSSPLSVSDKPSEPIPDQVAAKSPSQPLAFQNSEENKPVKKRGRFRSNKPL